jgi:ribonuclease R
LEAFAEMLEAYGLGSVATHDRKALQNVLQRLANEPPAARLVLNFAMLRSFQKAQYALENEGHYALSWPEYVHFTSPIRRYPDLIIHRLVKCALALPEPGYDPDELDALARQCSYLEQRAELAERDLKGIKSARYLSQRIGESFAAVVMTATPGGLFVRLLEVGLDAFVPVRSLGDEFFCYDGDRQALVGTSSGQVLRIGYECEVQIVAVDALKGQVDCVLAGASAPGASSES